MTPTYLPLLTISILFTFSKTVGILFRRISLPSVVGEIIGGVIIGPYALGGALDSVFHTPLLQINSTVLLFSEVAVILIIFSAAAENGLGGLTKTGPHAFLVAVGGAIVPLLLGFYFYIATGKSLAVAILLGSAMTATSLAITAEAMRRIQLEHHDEANLILNAAALDDVVSIVILAVALTILSTGKISASFVFIAAITATLTWFFMLVASITIIPQLMRILSRLRDESLLESSSLAVAFAMSVVSTIAGLTPVIGAYLGGLAMGSSRAREQAMKFSTTLKNAIGPLFFAVIGAELNFVDFLNVDVLYGLVALTVLAVLGKVAGAGIAALPALRNFRKAMRVGTSMIPRGEVGLVIAGIALQQNLVSQTIYAEIIGMVMLTSVIGPLATQRFYGRS